MSKIVRAIELGYGTVSVVTGTSNESFVIRTFPSLAVSVQKTRSDLSGAILQSRKTVVVPVGDNEYEVGEDIYSTMDPRGVRILNTNGFIDSERYKALFLGALKMIPEDEIDLLVCGLPVSVMPRKDDLLKLVVGKHNVGGGRSVSVKDAWILPQPLGGLLAYAREGGQERFNELKTQNTLLVDSGYLTVDWLVTRGLKANENRSGDFEGGMSKILAKVAETALNVFKKSDSFHGVKELNVELIDQAFISGKLKLFGKTMNFPVNAGEDGTPKFDFTDVVESVTNEAVEALMNRVGDAQDIDNIIVVGGPASLYVNALKRAFPNNKIVVMDNSLRAVVIGFQEGGIQRSKAMARISTMTA